MYVIMETSCSCPKCNEYVEIQIRIYIQMCHYIYVYVQIYSTYLIFKKVNTYV